MRASKFLPGCISLLVGFVFTSACGPRSGAPAEAPGPPPPAPSPAVAPVGSAEPSAEPSTAPSEPSASTAADAKTREVPMTCPGGAKACTPPATFAESVCRRKYPDLPLLMFAKGTPWPRMYVKAEYVEPVNAYGGERATTWLGFGEELLILKEHNAGGSSKVQVSGPADVDVLRWDGTCATIRKEMLVTYVTAPMSGMFITMKYLDAGIQEALMKDELVARAREAERKDCKGSSTANPSDGCKKALRKLTDVIILAVKKGIALPTPERLPEWKK